MKGKSESEVTQSCPTLCDRMACSLPGSSIHGIFQARILEWLPFPSPGDLPHLGIEAGSPTLQADALPSEPPGKPTWRPPSLEAKNVAMAAPGLPWGKSYPILVPSAQNLSITWYVLPTSHFPQSGPAPKRLRFTFKSKLPNIFLCPLAITGVAAPK